jgi:hypothetical protein
MEDRPTFLILERIDGSGRFFLLSLSLILYEVFVWFGMTDLASETVQTEVMKNDVDALAPSAS